jgi:hypothetical protein
VLSADCWQDPEVEEEVIVKEKELKEARDKLARLTPPVKH